MPDALANSFSEGLFGALIGAAIALVATYYQSRIARKMASEQRIHEQTRAWCHSASQAASSAIIVVRWIRDVDLTYLRGTSTHPDHPWPLITQLDAVIKDVQALEALAPDAVSGEAAALVREQLFSLKLDWLAEQYYEHKVQVYPGEFRVPLIVRTVSTNPANRVHEPCECGRRHLIIDARHHRIATVFAELAINGVGRSWQVPQ